MDVTQGIESQNKRLQVLKRWLAKPPARAAVLRLLQVGTPPLPLAQWTTDLLVPGLAHEIEALMSQHAEDLEKSEVDFLLIFETDAGQALVTKPMSVRRATSSMDDGTSIASQLDGSQQAWNQQMQRSYEALIRMFLTAQQAQTQSLIAIVTTLSTKIVEGEHRTDDARELSHALREAMVEMKHARPDDDEPQRLSPAMERLFGLLEAHGPMILAKLAA